MPEAGAQPPDDLFRVGRVLGTGAVATVHEVFDGEGRSFAGKFLHAARHGDANAERRFAQEAELLEGLAHEHIVRVYGMATALGTDGEERRFVRMERVEGESFDVWLAKHGPVSAELGQALALQLAEGLAYAHGHGVVHRDLKPANVLVARAEDPTPVLKIADFGMARASSLAGVDHSALAILGTPDYMAPEAVDPIAVDARADLYALGCMTYEMLVGAAPFSAATPFGVLRAHREEPVPDLPVEVPEPLAALVRGLLAKSPADRPPSALAVAERLRRQRAGELVALAPHGSSRCAACGEALVEQLAVCLGCGAPAVVLEAGPHAVVITGPGEIGDKLDSRQREALLDWLADNPHLGFRVRRGLAKRIPRLPVHFITGLSERSANAVVDSLARLGFEAELHRGLALRHTGLRTKARKLMGRVFIIAFSSAGLWNMNRWIGAAVAFVALSAAIVIPLGSLRAVAARSGRAKKSLEPTLAAVLTAIEASVGQIHEARYRHGLRALVRQGLELRQALGPGSGDDIALALHRAHETTLVLARTDAELRAGDLHDGSAPTRALLHHRDRLSDTIAQIAGSFEALHIRTRVAADARPTNDGLDALRAQVEALEEVERA